MNSDEWIRAIDRLFRRLNPDSRAARLLAFALLVEKITPVETPRGSVVEIKISIGTEVFSRKEFPVRLGNEPGQLSVGEFVELLGRDRLADFEFG